MVIIAKTTIADFGIKHPLAVDSLNNWYATTKNAEWSSFATMKQTFNSVDAVGNDRYCFNIKGNEFRLIVLIIFRTRTIFVLWFGSHSEYDKINKQIGAGNIQLK
ncbi:MAG: type II toxin-antitoxin system HigB family toxin [Alphaproteobacteria bacterium]